MVQVSQLKAPKSSNQSQNDHLSVIDFNHAFIIGSLGSKIHNISTRINNGLLHHLKGYSHE